MSNANPMITDEELMRFRIFAIMAGVQAWIGLVSLFFIPADPKNQIFLGLSIYRLSILIILFFLGLLSVGLFFWKKGAWTQSVVQFLHRSPKISQIIETVLEFGTIFGLFITITPILKPIQGISPFHQRLLPLLVWLTLISLEGAFLLAVENCQNEKSNLGTHFIHRWLGTKNTTVKGDLSTTRYGFWMAILLLIAVLVPSNNTAFFPGLPVNTWINGISLLIVLFFIIDRSLQTEWVNQLCRLYKPLKIILPAVLGLVIVLKLFIFWANSDGGFKACYRSTVNPPPNSQCELSFENPAFRNGITRMDKEINFDLENWNLSFFNTALYDYYGDMGGMDRKRIPFSVTWTGPASLSPGESLSIEYIGQGTITIGSSVIDLPPSYQDVKNQVVDLSKYIDDSGIKGNSPIQDIKINYTFDDGYRVGNSIPGPYAILRINVYQGNSINQGPLTTLPPPSTISLPLLLADGLILAVLVSILFIILRRLLPAWRGILLFSSLGILAWWGLPELSFMGIMALAFAWLLLWRGNHKLLLAYVVFSILLWFRVLIYLPDPSFSLLRLETSDMLAFETFARDILVTHTLRAGESVFDFMPLIRYFVFLYHIIFGESDFLRSHAILLLLNMGIFLNAERMYKFYKPQNRWRGIFTWILFLTLVMLTSSSVVFLIQQGISEIASWIFFVYAFYCLLLDSDRFFFVSSVLVGLAINNRYNQLPGLGFLLLIFGFPRLKTKKRLLLLSVLSIVLILALIPLHNWVYGHQLIFIPLSGYNSATVVVKPADLITIFWDPKVQGAVAKEISIMFGFVSWRMLDLCLPIFVLMTGWIVMGIDLICRWKKVSPQARWLWIVPAFFLGTQFFWYKLMNFPRQLYASYLAIALVGMYLGWYAQKTEKRTNPLITK